MRYKQLGQSGLTVSVVGLGCNNFGRRIGLAETRLVVEEAIENGVTLLDTADSYGDSETILGQVLSGRRDDVVIATKCGGDLHGRLGKDWGVRASRRYIRRAIEASLARLRTDYIDLYQIHWPDPHTPIEETLAALHELVLEGKVRYLGSCNFAAWQVVDAEWTARTQGLTRFVSAQNHFNLLERSAERELAPACMQQGIGLLPYYPLAKGVLTGRYRRAEAPPAGSRIAEFPDELSNDVFDRLEALDMYARERGVTMLEVAVGWLASQPTVSSVITGATRAEQVRANVGACSWTPEPSDLAALDGLLLQVPICKSRSDKGQQAI